MKLWKKGTVGALCLAMLVSVAGCSQGTGSTTETTTALSTAATAPVSTVDDDVENPVDVSGIKLETEKKDIEPCTLTYLGNYDVTKAGDIKPSVKYLEQEYGCTIEVEIVGFTAIEESIVTRIQGDMSPDLVDKQDTTFPHWMSKNMFEPLDGLIDMDASQWADFKEYADRYEWNGKHYYYPWMFSVSPYMCIYNRGLFEEDGIDDPYELYRSGKWDWDAFKKCMVDFVDAGEDRLGFYGYYASAFVNANGATFVDIDENGRLVNNMKDSKVEEAQNFLQELRKQGLGNFQYGDYINVSQEPVIYGNAAFHIIGGWKITDYAKAQVKDDNLDIFFVPVPRSPSADDYYYAMSTFGYLVPAGSKHAAQAAEFINCCRLSMTDTDLLEARNASILKNKKYTEEMDSFLHEFDSPVGFKTIIDESFGFSTDTTEIVKSLLADVAFDQSEEQQSWTQMRDTYYQIIQDEIDKYNAYLT